MRREAAFKVLLVAGLAASCTLPAICEESVGDRLTLCAAITLPLGRLQCYDAVAGRVSQSDDGGDKATETNWTVTDDASELDRSRRVILAHNSAASAGGSPAIVALRCMEKQTSLVVGVPDFLGIQTEGVSIRYRIGDMDPVSDRWSAGGDHNNWLFGPSGNAAMALIRHMAASKDFVIRVSKYNGEQIQYTFALDGLSEHVHLLADACKWPAIPSAQSPSTANRPE